MKEIFILGRRIQIMTCPKSKLQEFAQEQMNDDTLAWYESSDDTIYIWSGLEGRVFKRVLLHEIAHVMLSVSGMTHLLSHKQEEAVCDMCENFLNLFEDKKFVGWINE
jgi:uncharacterized Zn finger protein